jgi:tetratricopeptide (TPR) repeat protein
MAVPPVSRPQSGQRHLSSALATIAATCGILALARPHDVLAQAAAQCGDWRGELTVVEGSVELQSGGSLDWRAAATGSAVCLGDTLRVARSARALLTLPDGSNIKLDENTTIVLDRAAPSGGSLLDLVRGLIHVISRDPRELRFTTPHVNAGLEGTEFDIGVNEAGDQTEIAVLEGAVKVSSTSGEIEVEQDQLGVGKRGQAPVATPLARPIELMRWTSYYRPIFDGALPSLQSLPTASESTDPEFFSRRAAALLGTARLESANADLATALRLRPEHPSALAVQAMIALGHADVEGAAGAATRAAVLDPAAIPALLALSYVEQARGDVAAAERAARAARAANPESALAAARSAELRLGAGDTAAAIELAMRAHQLDPTQSAPLVVLGFAELATFATQRAEQALREAVELAPQAPEPRVGLALAAARRGEVAESRRHLEIAVANDPTDGLVRSYMAKLYEMDRRTDLGATQLELARELSPHDATPWLYAALSDLHRNRPIEALQGLRGAAARNGDEVRFRSNLIVDDDLATRSAGMARIYTSLGFGRLALLDAWRAIDAAPTDYSGHRLLADAYATEPRHEVARVSELLVAQLLQPANVTPIKPQLGQPGLNLAQRIGPSPLSFDEFSAPIARHGPRLSASSIAGGNGTLGSELTVAGLNDRVSYSGGYFRVDTDGFRPNNDYTQEIANAFIQFRPSSSTNLQAELRAVRGEQGDLTAAFDREAYSALQRQTQEIDVLRLGAHHRISERRSLLASLIHQDVSSTLGQPALFELDAERAGYGTDLQYIVDAARHRLQTGLIYTAQQETIESSFGSSLPSSRTDAELRHVGAYGYWHRDVADAVTVTLGASFDRVEDQVSDEALNPKLGIVWRPTAATTVRAAAFKSLFGSLTTSLQNPQPRLEPVQVAGFTQLITGGIADRSEVAGIGIDHAITSRILIGAEATDRETDRPLVVATGLPSVQHTRIDERSEQAYVLLTPTDRISLSARHERGRYRSNPVPLYGMASGTTRRTPIEGRYFFGNGFTVGARATQVRQDGVFEGASPTPFAPPTLTAGSDSFVILDAFASYRLPNRRGIVSVSADNLLDETFQYQDVDPTNPTYIPERLVSVRFTLAFD